MNCQPARDIRAIAREFDLLGEFLGAEPYGSGPLEQLKGNQSPFAFGLLE